MPFLTSKVTPVHQDQEDKEDEVSVVIGMDMYVILLHTLLKRYGGERHSKIEQYKEFRDRGELILWKYVPPDSTIIYISHEWVGKTHPDPQGDHFYHLVLLLERLLRGDVDRTDMDAFHSLLYKHNCTTTAEEWRCMLDPEKTFIFYDGFCVSKEERDEAFRFVPEIIKRCDFMIILAPGCTHFDKIDPRTGRKMNLCYRTYRLNAMCVFEMFSAFLTTKGGEQVRPALLVRSGQGKPNWSSPLECLKLAVGTSIFDCCETNHERIETCQRPSVKQILVEMIHARVASLFRCEGTISEARWTACFETWWLRGLSDSSERTCISTSAFKRNVLRWNVSSSFDEEGYSILGYASLYNDTNVVNELLREVNKISDKHARAKCLVSRVPKKGLSNLGITGEITALVIAMGFSSSEIVSLLLKHGADPYEHDVTGNDGFMMGSIFGRTDNVKFWLKRFPDWDVERTNSIAGIAAFGLGIHMGPKRFELAKLLLTQGSSPTRFNARGSSALMSLCSNEDSDISVLKHLLGTSCGNLVNVQRHAKTLKWKMIYRLAKSVVRFGLSDSGLMRALASQNGATALHHAVQR